MRHADEGTLHAWLDGALVGEEAATVRQHLALCVNCRARLDEAERLRDEADAILAGAAPAQLPAPPFGDVVARARELGAASAVVVRPLRRGTAMPWRGLGWAATILLGVAFGWFAHGAVRSPQRIAANDRGRTAPEKVIEHGMPVDLVSPAAASGGATPAAQQPARGAPVPAATTSPTPASQLQALRAPAAVAPDIQPPVARAETREADVAAQAAGVPSDGRRVVTALAQDISAAPTFTPFTVGPELKNRDEALAALRRFYPPLLRDSGVGGLALVWALIGVDGSVQRVQLKTTSGYPDMDAAAIRVTHMLRFSPPLNRDQVVRVWVQLPILFKPEYGFSPPAGGRVAQAAGDTQTGSSLLAVAPSHAAAPAADATGRAVPAAPGRADAGVPFALNEPVNAGYAAPRAAAERTRLPAPAPAPPPASRVTYAVPGLPIIRSLPRSSAELSHVLQRLPSGDTIEVIFSREELGRGQPQLQAKAGGIAPGANWSVVTRPGMNVISAAYQHGAVTIRGLLPQDSLAALLRRVPLPTGP